MTSALEDFPARIREWARELGFSDIGITRPETGVHAQRLQQWLEQGLQGEMEWMGHHGDKRYTPTALVPGTERVISVRMDYRNAPDNPQQVLQDPEKAYVTRYALGRDYHKLIRKRLTHLAKRIDSELHGYDYRAFTDSAPVMEKALAQRAGLGWIGKNTLVLNPKAGSYFFLGRYSRQHRCRLRRPLRKTIAAAAQLAWIPAPPMPLPGLTCWMPGAASAI